MSKSINDLMFDSYKNVSSTVISTNVMVSTGEAIVRGFHIDTPAGAAADNVAIYDSTAASGTILIKVLTGASEGERNLEVPGNGVSFPNGCFVAITTASAASVSMTLFYNA